MPEWLGLEGQRVLVAGGAGTRTEVAFGAGGEGNVLLQ